MPNNLQSCHISSMLILTIGRYVTLTITSRTLNLTTNSNQLDTPMLEITIFYRLIKLLKHTTTESITSSGPHLCKMCFIMQSSSKYIASRGVVGACCVLLTTKILRDLIVLYSISEHVITKYGYI